MGHRARLAWSSAPAGLAVMFAAGLAIRLVLARGGHYVYDTEAFRSWAARLLARGPRHFYPAPGESSFSVDYPPGYLYVLWGLGALSRRFGSGEISVFAIKAVPIAADLGLAWVVSVLAGRMLPHRQSARVLAAAAVLLNPAVFFVSSVWGQVDAIGALLVAAALLALATGSTTFRREAAGMVLLALAVGTKPQTALVFPVIAIVLVRRHGVESGRVVIHGAARLAALLTTGALAWLALLWPFDLGALSGVRFYTHAVSTYKLTSAFAFNAWGAFGFSRPDVGAGGVHVLGVPAFFVGLGLFGVGAAWILVKTWQHAPRPGTEGSAFLFGCIAMTLAGFTLLTRIHERYLFVAVALAAVLVAVRPFARAVVGLSVLFLSNLVLPYLDHFRSLGSPMPRFGSKIYSLYGLPAGDGRIRVLSALTAALCIFVVVRGWSWLEGETEASARPMEQVEAEHAPEVHSDAEP